MISNGDFIMLVMCVSGLAGLVTISILLLVKKKWVKWFLSVFPFTFFLIGLFFLISDFYSSWRYNHYILPGKYTVYSNRGKKETEIKSVQLVLSDSQDYMFIKDGKVLNKGAWRYKIHYMPTLILSSLDNEPPNYYEIYSSDDIRICCSSEGVEIDGIDYSIVKFKKQTE